MEMARSRMQRHWQERHGDRVMQDSSLLHLPGEIRTLIYCAALYCPHPIDLWTDEYIDRPESDPSLAPRIAKSLLQRPRFSEQWTPNFRRQSGLEYVRKEMVINLLGTCRQIFNEAAPIFWSKNTWRFSGDHEWLGVRRFFGCIGPRALSLIPSIEVFAPFAKPGMIDACLQRVDDSTGSFSVIRAKNVPKMHMGKGYWNKKDADLDDNLTKIRELLELANTTIRLHFILPGGFKLEDKSFPGIDLGIGIPRGIELGPTFTEMTLVVEAGAHLYGLDLVNEILDYDISVLSLPGSLWKPDPTASDDETTVITTKKWLCRTSSEPYIDYISSISTMWADPEEISVHSRGGRAYRPPPNKTLSRALKGFGGCIFTYFDGLRCSQCGSTTIVIHDSWRDTEETRCTTCLGWISTMYTLWGVEPVELIILRDVNAESSTQ